MPRESLRNATATKLRAAAVALEFADARLRENARHWPSASVDMTPHEIEETSRLLRGIAIRLRTEIAQLEPGRAKATA